MRSWVFTACWIAAVVTLVGAAAWVAAPLICPGFVCRHSPILAPIMRSSIRAGQEFYDRMRLDVDRFKPEIYGYADSADEPMMRGYAINVLVENRDAHVVPIMISHIHADPDWWVRLVCCVGLEQMTVALSIPHLKAALRDPDERVRRFAIISLRKIGDRSLEVFIAPLAADPSALVRDEVATP